MFSDHVAVRRSVPLMDQSGGYGFSNVEDGISQQERSLPGAATGASG